MTPRKYYVKNLFSKFGYLGTWLPNAPMRLGDFGTISDSGFENLGNINDLGLNIEFEASKSTLDFSFSCGVEIGASNKTETNSVPINTEISFKGAGGFIFKASECRIETISNRIELAKSIKRLYFNNEWDKEWCVVHEVVCAKSLTVLISNTKNSSASICTPPSKNTLLDCVEIINSDSELSYKSGNITEVKSKTETTPLILTSKIKENFLKKLIGSQDGLKFGGKGFTPQDTSLTQKAPEEPEIWEKQNILGWNHDEKLQER